MSNQLEFLALDLGRRVVALYWVSSLERLRLSEARRFPNGPVRLSDGLHRDVLRLWTEIKRGLALAVQEHGTDLAGVGLDTWGVDFGPLDRDGALISNPYYYRWDEAYGRFLILLAKGA